MDAAKHARNRYLLTFSPSNPTPGLHTIRVRPAQDYGARIVARANYWIDEEEPDGAANEISPPVLNYSPFNPSASEISPLAPVHVNLN